MSIIPDNVIALQGTKVLEDHEIRRSFCYMTKEGPQKRVSKPILKYTGTERAPLWMDVEQGDVFSSSNDFVKNIKAKQTSSRPCAKYGQISPLLHL